MRSEVKAVGLITGARIAATVGDTLLHNHRTESHRATKTSGWYQNLARAEQRTAGIHSHEWAADHRLLHHQFPDADLFPIWKTYLYLQEAEKRGLEIPSQFQGYDRKVSSFTPDEIVEMGGYVDTYVATMFGPDHWSPNFENMTDTEIFARMRDDKPKYEYDPSFFDREKIYTDEEALHIMLRDQHSPLLAPTKQDGSWNGVRFVLFNQLKLSRVPTQLLRQRPDLFPEDLRPENPDDVQSNHKMVVAGFGVASLAALALIRDTSPKGFAKAIALGSFANGLGLGFLEKGGSAVNGYGHMGPATTSNILKATFKKDFDIDINPDGSIATDTVFAGILGKVISILTGDEAGQQWGHHKFPGAIAYPNSNGEVSWRNAPTGTLFETMADSPYVSFVQRGEGLSLNEFGRRPDDQNPAVDIIQRARVRTKYEKTSLTK